MTVLLFVFHFALDSPPPLLVARADGVHIVDPQGKVQRTLLPHAVTWAHRLPDGHLVVDRGPKGLFVLPSTGKPRALATLPSVRGCGFGPADPKADPKADAPLQVQSVDDVTHSADGRWLCVSLMDRNANMAEVRADFDIELATGKVTARLALAPGCPDPKLTPNRCGPPARPKPAVQPVKKTWAFAWMAERGKLTGKSGVALDLCAGRPADQCDPSMSVAVSPSGQWRLVRLPTGMGDYMHHALFAVDHQTGAVHPIVEGTWPPALTGKQRQTLQQDYAAVPTLDVVGETYIAPTGHGEGFIVDNLLINPGKSVIRVGQFVP